MGASPSLDSLFFRPFPYEEMRKQLKGKKLAIVIDRNLSPGMGGIFAQEIKNAMYALSDTPKIVGVVTGLGGRDITPEILREIIIDSERQSDTDAPIIWKGLKNMEEHHDNR